MEFVVRTLPEPESAALANSLSESAARCGVSDVVGTAVHQAAESDTIRICHYPLCRFRKLHKVWTVMRL